MRTAKEILSWCMLISAGPEYGPMASFLDSLKTGLHKRGELLDRLSNYLEGGEKLWWGVMVVGPCLRL